jgi:glutamyl aminopeptidase
VFAACDKLDQVGHSLKVQQHVTTYFEELYKLPYALPKVDLIAIPDFVTGAMEQWGLITYRETSLLYDSVADATSPRQSKSSTISHEYVHQWFGNLVTCKWWDNIWIQEGPATFWSQEGIEEAYENDPWDMEKQQIYNSITYSLNRDVSVTGRPIVSPARNPDEITAAFDWVIYDKAASIIYTLREAMGKVSFDNATTQFLTDFQFKGIKTPFIRIKSHTKIIKNYHGLRKLENNGSALSKKAAAFLKLLLHSANTATIS